MFEQDREHRKQETASPLESHPKIIELLAVRPGPLDTEHYRLLGKECYRQAAFEGVAEAVEAMELLVQLGDEVLYEGDRRRVADRMILSRCFEANGQFALAEQQLHEAKAIQAKGGAVFEDRLELHEQAFRLCTAAEEYDHALSWARQGEKLAEDNPAVSLAQLTRARCQTAEALWNLGEQGAAFEKFVHLYFALRHFANGENPSVEERDEISVVLRSLSGMLRLFDQGQRFQESEAVAREMVRLASLSDESSSLVPLMKMRHAETVWNTGKSAEALELLQDLATSLPPGSEHQRACRTMIASLYKSTGEHLAGERELARLCGELRKELPESGLDFTRVAVQLGYAQLSQGRALAATRTAKAIWDCCEDVSPSEIFAALRSPSSELQFELTKAQRELGIPLAALNPLLDTVAECYQLEASAKTLLHQVRSVEMTAPDEGPLSEALEYQKRSLALKELLSGGAPGATALATMGVGQLMREAEPGSEGREMFERAFELAETGVKALEGWEYLQVLFAEARLLNEEGDTGRAGSVLRQAEEMFARFPRYQGGVLEAMLCEEKALFCFASGESGEGIDLLERARVVLENNREEYSPRMLGILVRLNEAYEVYGFYEAARKTNEQVVAILTALQVENDD